MDFQHILVLLTAVGAVVFLVRKYRREARQPDCGGGCTGCSAIDIDKLAGPKQS